MRCLVVFTTRITEVIRREISIFMGSTSVRSKSAIRMDMLVRLFAGDEVSVFSLLERLRTFSNVPIVSWRAREIDENCICCNESRDHRRGSISNMPAVPMISLFLRGRARFLRKPIEACISCESWVSLRIAINGMCTREVCTNSMHASSERARLPSMMQAHTWSCSCGLSSQRRREAVNGETTGHACWNSGRADMSERT